MSYMQTLRGTVLRDASQGPGIISINGQQHQFTLETHWRSDKPPVAGSRVDATISQDGKLEQLILIEEAQIAKEKAMELAGFVRSRGAIVGAKAIDELGLMPLIAIALLAVSWFAFSFLTLQVSYRQSVGFTFWELLQIANGDSNLLGSFQSGVSSSGAGVYGVLALVAIALPLLPLLPMAKNSRFAAIGLVAPLAVMACVVVRLYVGVKSGMSAVGDLGGLFGQQGASLMNQMAGEMMSRAMKAAGFGLGFYVACALSIYLAYVGYKRYRNT